MSRQYDSNGRDQFNVEKNHGNINIFNTGFDAFKKFANHIFPHITPVSLQNCPKLSQYSSDQENLKLKREEVRIQQERLNHEKNHGDRIIEIQEKEFQSKCKYFDFRLKLIREYQAEKIQLKLQEFQEIWDAHNSSLLISKRETYQFFTQKGDEFSILIAPPKIPNSLEELSFLEKQLEYNIKNTLERLYSSVSEEPSPIIRYHQLFKSPI